MSTDCLFHQDKPKFDGLCKDLQRAGWIPRGYVHRLAMAVCACRRRKEWKPEESVLQADIEFLRKNPQSESDSKPVPANLQKFVDQLLNDAAVTDYSSSRLVNILHKAKLGDFNCLKRKQTGYTNEKTKAAGKGEDGEKQTEESKPKKQKLDKKQLKIVLNKKKKQMKMVDTVEIPLKQQNVSQLKTELGGSFEKFGFEKKCFLDLDQTKNRGVSDGTAKTFIKVQCLDQGAFEEIHKVLTDVAKKIEEKDSEPVSPTVDSTNSPSATDDWATEPSAADDWANATVPVPHVAVDWSADQQAEDWS